MEENTKVTRGEIVLFSSGEYSDYSYVGQVIFTKDCDLKVVKDVYKEHCKKTKETTDSGGFVTFLCALEFCLPLQCKEVHLGSYGELLGEDTLDWDD